MNTGNAGRRDPKPSVERIEQLAQRIIDGDILLPKFQRDFVWNENQVINLLDSVSKNYPIGSILLWLSKQNLRSETSIAGLPFRERAEEYPVNYLLDGQQRLSCICGALFWKEKEGKATDIWNIVYDLKAKKFVLLDTLDSPPLYQIRLNKIPVPSAYFQHVAALKTLSEENVADLEDEAHRIFNIFKDYSVASVTLHDMPIEDVAPIFERINSTGTKLTIVDLMRAATWSESFDLVDTIDDEVLEVIAAKGFGEIDRRVVLRVLSSASGFSFATPGIDRLRSRTPVQLKEAAGATVNAFKLAVDFLNNQLHVPNEHVLPYINQLVVIAEVFRVQPALNAGQLIGLKKWFWRTTLSSYFSGWNSSQMDTDREAVAAFATGQSPELEVPVSKPNNLLWSTKGFRSNNAHSKMLGLMLTQNLPQDLVSGQKISLAAALAWQNNKEYHHIFPKAYLAGMAVPPNRINALCNFALISSSSNKIISDEKPSVYLAKCRATMGGEHFSSVLASNLISEEALYAALDDDFDAFTAARAKSLGDYADSLCGW